MSWAETICQGILVLSIVGLFSAQVSTASELRVCMRSQEFLDLSSIASGLTAPHVTGIRCSEMGFAFSTVKIDSVISFVPEFPRDAALIEAAREYRWFTIEMAASKGHRVQRLWQVEGDDKSFGVTIPIIADGRIRRYIVDLMPLFTRMITDSLNPPRTSDISKIGLIPSEEPGADIVIRAIGFGRTPLGSAHIDVINVRTTPDVARAGEEVEVVVDFMNIGQEISGQTEVRIDGEGFTLPPMAPCDVVSRSIRRIYPKYGRELITVAFGSERQENHIISIYRPADDPAAVPEPQIASTPYLIGAHYYPGWAQGAGMGWNKLVPYPERTPVLGWYDEGSSEIADWEIKWALEHGVSFFVYCWYRAGYGSPVDSRLSHAIHDGLFNARYRDLFKFAIMWEIGAGTSVESEEDLLENLLPYWIEEYFSKPYYLKIDNKPLLFIYEPMRLVNALGSERNVASAFDKMREIARAKGFDGMYILAEHRWNRLGELMSAKTMGFDLVFPYLVPAVSMRPEPMEAVNDQISYLEQAHKLSPLPALPSFLWDGILCRGTTRRSSGFQTR